MISSSTSPAVRDNILSEQILQAALQLYLQHGLKKVTLNDIADRIGKTRSVLYYYYKDKKEIFEAVMEMLLRETTNEIGQEIAQAATLKNKLRAFCFAKIKTSEARKSVFTALEADMDSEEMSQHTQTMLDIHKRMMQAESDLLNAIISESVKNGEIRRLKPQEHKMLISLLLCGIRGIKRETGRNSDFNKPSATIDLLVEMTMKWLSE